MKRKTWVSILCGGFLLLAVAVPAGATGWSFVQPRPAVLELVMDWFSGWLPGSEVESRVPVDRMDRGEPTERIVAASCEEGDECDMTVVTDPDG
jgi:hypothetical protein